MSDERIPPPLEIDMSAIANFRAVIGRGRPYLDRMSTLIWVDIYALSETYGVNPFAVLRSIDQVEGLEPEEHIKPAEQFRRAPLKGLWHKHYFAARFIAHNITNALGKTGLEKIVREVLDPTRSPVITEEMVAEIAHRVTNVTFEKRSAEGKLTGEWIVYARHDGVNYYLTCKPHPSGDRVIYNDQVIYDEIARHCPNDFPDILKWIEESADAM